MRWPLLVAAIGTTACTLDAPTASEPSAAAPDVTADVAVSATVPWDVTVLPLLPGGTWSEATAINDAGVIVGFGDAAGGVVHAFRYSNGTLTDLGTTKGYPTTRALGINANGQVVGYATTTARPRATTAVTWSPAGAISKLPGVDSVSGSKAYGINLGGTVVGSYRNPAGDWHAARWTSGRLEDLNSWLQPGLNSEARAINTAGVAVGFGAFHTTHGFYSGVMWDVNKTPTFLLPLESFPLAADSSQVYDINQAGDWVGWSSYPLPGSSGAYISSIIYEFYPPGAGVIAAPEVALSDKLRMVGTLAQSTRMRAFTSRWLYHFGSTGDVLPVPLNYSSSKGADVNTCGRVVGWVQGARQLQRRATLWTRYVFRGGVKTYPCD